MKKYLTINTFTACLRVFLLCLICFSLSQPVLANETKAMLLTKTSQTWNGADLPGYPRGVPEITILRIKIPANTTLPWHPHPVINAGVLISGELTVTTRSGKTLVMKAGDPIVEVVDTWHYGKNTGKTDADIIVFYAGTKGAPVTVKE
ncbi:MAG: cupin domain-containing protein [Desulfobacter sp.]|nr:cupin domain-containing protein [Desulfobacter sp.]WDP84175.1 MAG: cupin domain-containing protein [Desulfobacter sp.]